MEAENGVGFTSKKIEALRRRRERRVKGLAELGEDAHPNVKAYYEIQVTVIDYDIEDAVKSEAKRRTRLALKHIEKKLAEVEALRLQVQAVLFEDEPLGWTGRMDFREELDKVFDMPKVLYGE